MVTRGSPADATLDAGSDTTARGRTEPFFHGAYVPTGASGMVQLTVWAEATGVPQPVLAFVSWGAPVVLSTSAPLAGHLTLELSNIRVLDGMSAGALDAAREAIAGWINRILADFVPDGTEQVRFDESRTSALWGDRILPADPN